ncbi:MAG: hypothetical protein JSV63_01705 [Candidatus Aenigmatarchaeota archaeon]|nr:MAG: hypothetical protein JSV63_01705 [Candidatus Aenigmarchaeota archaeon]
MLDLIEKAFAKELLSVSQKADEVVEFAWTIYNIGGNIPVTALGGQFQDAETTVADLSKAGILRYAMGGFINRDQKKLSLSVTLSEDLARQLPQHASRKDFEGILFRDYGEKIIPVCRTNLTEALAAMLTSIIFYATPERAAFANTIVRRAANVSLKTHLDCQNILEYYLHRFLGLVTFETGSLLNLSVRSKQRVRMYPKIWDIYVRPFQEKEREEEPVPRVFEPQAARPAPTDKESEQEKKLRGYFPWLKL